LPLDKNRGQLQSLFIDFHLRCRVSGSSHLLKNYGPILRDMKYASTIANSRFQRRWFATLLSVCAVALVAIIGYLIWSSYREAIQTAETTSRNYADIVDARLEATLRRADSSLRKLVKTLPIAVLNKQVVQRYAGDLNANLDLELSDFPELSGIRVYDADGDQLYTTNRKTTRQLNIADRAYFRQTRDGASDDLVISGVVAGRGPQSQPIIVLSRALRDEKGNFHGIVNAVINLKYFQNLFRSLDLGPRGTFSIYQTDDFSQVVRWPENSGGISRPLETGSVLRTALENGIKSSTHETKFSGDGVLRIFSFQVLDKYPFAVTAALAVDDILSGWRTRSLTVGLLGLLALFVLGGLLTRLWRAEVRQEQLVLQLLNAKSAAEEASKAKTNFIANMSHELRTPLNAILGFSEMLRSEKFAIKRTEYARLIHGSGQHLLSLISDILDLSKLEAGRLVLRDTVVDFGLLVSECVKVMGSNAKTAHVALVSDVPKYIPRINGDERALKQILFNLVSNAIKYTRVGGNVTVFVRLEETGDFAFGVRDNGIGIADDEQKLVFDRFGQGRHDVVREARGAGLGLPIVKGLVLAHGGRVLLQSKVDVGTCVTVFLPASRVYLQKELRTA
jgi:two-component system, cell cycle sensor histidine kinase PleC